MKTNILLILLFLPLFAIGQEPDFCNSMLVKAKKALNSKDYNRSREYCENGLQLCNVSVDSFKIVVKRINKAIDLEKRIVVD